MRVDIELGFKEKLVLPIQYNYIMQAVVLKWLGDENYSKFVHNKGYEYNKRRYKMYTFSKVFGKFKIDKASDTITFFNKANFTVSSADDEFLIYFVAHILRNHKFQINFQEVRVNKSETGFPKVGGKAKVYTKSPIVAYSTFEIENRKKTYYYSPYEKDFSEMLRKNLINKYKALHGAEPEDTSFTITTLNNDKLSESVVRYKDIVIKGWNGEFFMEGSPELLQLAYDTGLGSKNSQGFGCVEFIKNNE